MSQLNPNPLYRLRAFRWISKVNALIGRTLEGVHSAIFMGVMDDSVFQKYDTYPFGDWEGASEVTGNGKDVEDWLDAFISGEVTPDVRVLVVGAGGGNELLKLHECGCSVSGVEFDESLFSKTAAMLEKRSFGSEIEFRHAERFKLDNVSNDFDVVIVPRFYTSYIQSRAERVRFLSACRERLKEGGVIAFDYFTRPESKFSPGSLIFKVQPGVSNLLRIIRGGRSRRIETGDHLDPQVPLLHHHFNRADLSLELSEAGLSADKQGETWFGWSVAKRPLDDAPVKALSRTPRSAVSSPVPEISHS